MVRACEEGGLGAAYLFDWLDLLYSTLQTTVALLASATTSKSPASSNGIAVLCCMLEGLIILWSEA